MKKSIVHIGILWYSCCATGLVGLMCHLGSCSPQGSNQNSNNNNNHWLYSFVSDWPSSQILPASLRQLSLCEGDALLEDQDERQRILTLALPQAGCEKHLGAWLFHQNCIQRVRLWDSINTTNPPQRTFSLDIETKGEIQGKAGLIVLDHGHDDSKCKTSCKFESDFACKGRFLLWRFWVSNETAP